MFVLSMHLCDLGRRGPRTGPWGSRCLITWHTSWPEQPRRQQAVKTIICVCHTFQEPFGDVESCQMLGVYRIL